MQKTLTTLFLFWLSTTVWAAGPLPKEGIALAPFRDVGLLPTLLLNPLALQEGLAAPLESHQGMTVMKLDQPPLDPQFFLEPNSQLIPPALRSKVGILPSSSSSRSDWLKIARDRRAKVLLLGTYEQAGVLLRLSAEGLDPFTNKTLFNCQVEGATSERLSLEGSLVEKMIEGLTPSGAITDPAPPKKKDVVPDTSALIVPATGPETADGHYENGFALTRRFDQTGEEKYLDGAIEEYKAALVVEPNHFRSLNNLGTVLHRKGNYEEALRYYLRVIELNPKYARAMENAAMAYRALGKTTQAKEMWRKALEHEERPDVRTVIQQALDKMEEETPQGTP